MLRPQRSTTSFMMKKVTFLFLRKYIINHTLSMEVNKPKRTRDLGQTEPKMGWTSEPAGAISPDLPKTVALADKRKEPNNWTADEKQTSSDWPACCLLCFVTALYSAPLPLFLFPAQVFIQGGQVKEGGRWLREKYTHISWHIHIHAQIACNTYIDYIAVHIMALNKC